MLLVIAFIYLVAPKGAVGSCMRAISNTAVRPTGFVTPKGAVLIKISSPVALELP